MTNYLHERLLHRVGCVLLHDSAIYAIVAPMHTAEASSILLGMTNSVGMPDFAGEGTTALMETTSATVEPTITPTEPSTAPGFSETGEWDRAT